jgi:hypothetical protein
MRVDGARSISGARSAARLLSKLVPVFYAALFFSLLFAGCDREPPSGGRGPLEPIVPAAEAFGCDRALGQVRRVLVVELAGVPGATVPLERALTVAAASCRAEAWPEPLRRCLIDAPLAGGATGLWRCAEQVPAPLRARLERELRAAVER